MTSTIDPQALHVAFFAEAVTLAHVARPLTLAASLEDKNHKVSFACNPQYHHMVEEHGWSLHSLSSIPQSQFLRALAKGDPVYSYSDLKKYVEEDLALLEDLQPNVVVGDFRLSLSVSARLLGIPYFTISNAYWSPYAHPEYIAPDIPVVALLGPKAGTHLFRLIRPMAFAYHALPMNRLRRHFGLPSLGASLQQVYTDADHTLYADIPELIPTRNLPSNHHYLGPLIWNPPSGLPDWWEEIPEDRPSVYVTLGSSGDAGLLDTILSVLADFKVSVLVATAGKGSPSVLPENAFICDYLPGETASQRSSLVICNGGSPTTHQALISATPVIGIASNLDQYLNMSFLQKAGVGVLMRSGSFSASTFHSIVKAQLNANSESGERAIAIQNAMKSRIAGEIFDALISDYRGNR